MRARAALPLLACYGLAPRATSAVGLSVASANTTATALQTSRRSFGGALAVTRPAASPSPPRRQQLTCPECGKRFLREGILREHRRTRHLVSLPTPEEEASAAAEGEIRALKEQLRCVRENIKALRSGGTEQQHHNKTGKLQQQQQSSGEDVAPYPAAQAHGRIFAGVSDAVLRGWATRDPAKAIGTSISSWTGVGTVVKGSVRLGTLEGFSPSSATPSPPPPTATERPPRVLQFALETLGHRERRPGQLKMFRNRVTVRSIFPAVGGGSAALFTVRPGDVLRVQGHYAQHRTYDAVSKSFVENVIVETDMVGLLRRGPEPSAVADAVQWSSAHPTPLDVADVASVVASRGFAAPVRLPHGEPAAPRKLKVKKKRRMKHRITGK